jgi:autotransporter-associated beta strand protein
MVAGTTQTLTLTGTNSYSGTTTISGGVLQVSADGSLGAVPPVESGNVTLNGGTLQWGASFNLNANRDISLGASGGTIDTNGVGTTVGGHVTGAGSLTKVGAGTLTLTNTNSYADTTINAGTLLVASTGSMSAVRTVTVNSSAILSGSGRVGNIDAVGGTVDVGMAILTATSADFSLGGNLQVEISGYSTGNYGQLNLSGNLALGSTSSLTVDGTGLTSPGTAVGVVTYGSHSGPTAFATTKVINNPDNFQATTAAGATGLNVTLSLPVPVLTSLGATSGAEGGTGSNLTVTGRGFVSGSVVQWNSRALATTFVSGTQLSAAIPATYLAEESTATITVFNPNPGGGTSSGLTFTINDAALSAAPVAIGPVAGAPFFGAIVTFSDADPNGMASDYSATIDWGNGTTSAGTISPNGLGGFTVSGSTIYGAAGPYTIYVSIQDAGGAKTAIDSPITVADLGIGVQRGQSAGVGFWQNKNGQALINSFTGGPTSTALSSWLAATLPHLYGANACPDNLSGQTNAQVAAFYLSLFSQQGPKLDAQVLDTALDVYATTLSLGGAAAQAYGFDVTAYGLGASDYNVGANGAAFGVANDTTLTVFALLKDADSLAVNGVLYNRDLTMRNEALNVFSGINSLGGL